MVIDKRSSSFEFVDYKLVIIRVDSAYNTFDNNTRDIWIKSARVIYIFTAQAHLRRGQRLSR